MEGSMNVYGNKDKQEFLQQTYHKEPAGQQNSRIIGFYFISPAGCPNCLHTDVPTRVVPHTTCQTAACQPHVPMLIFRKRLNAT